MRGKGLPGYGKAGSGSSAGGGGRGGRPPVKPRNLMDNNPRFTKHPSGNYIEKATGKVYSATGRLVTPKATKSSAVKVRAKKIASSAAAKDIKKVAKVAGPVGAAAYALKKSNDATQKDMRKLEQLRQQYEKSAAKNSMSFNDYVKKYGK